MLNSNILMEVLKKIGIAVLVWSMVSFMSSIVKATLVYDNCGKTYPIDYVLYTNLFCEIKGGD